jgi:hypothetical protein
VTKVSSPGLALKNTLLHKQNNNRWGASMSGDNSLGSLVTSQHSNDLVLASSHDDNSLCSSVASKKLNDVSKQNDVSNENDTGNQNDSVPQFARASPWCCPPSGEHGLDFSRGTGENPTHVDVFSESFVGLGCMLLDNFWPREEQIGRRAQIHLPDKSRSVVFVKAMLANSIQNCRAGAADSVAAESIDYTAIDHSAAVQFERLRVAIESTWKHWIVL